MNADEAIRRKSNTEKLREYFEARPLEWLPWRDLAKACDSACSWRTRIADYRRIVKRDGGDVVWNGNVHASAYMLIPYPQLGRPAHEYREQKGLF